MRKVKYEKSLEFKNPELAKEWHPIKNGDLTPRDVTAGSGKIVWWYLPYDDPETSRHFDFEWKATISDRNHGKGCPYLSGKTVWPGFNDLASRNPDLAKEWHPTKNGTLTPKDVRVGSRKAVWWYLPYDDLEIGRHFDFEWKAVVSSRNDGAGCPYLSGQAVWPGFNDLASGNPDLAKEWHPTKNGTLTPKDVTTNSGKTVWWYLPYDDPENGKHFNFEWEAGIDSRNAGNGCPYLSGQAVWPGFNDLASRNPDLAKEWHPTKNGTLTPKDVTTNSEKTVWWYLPYDDPETGKHFDFEWKVTISSRSSGTRCPYFSGQAVWPGFNDLASRNPDLAKEWHPTKNGTLTPRDVATNSNNTVWWYMPYDDPETGRHFDFEWKATVNNRNRGKGCPYLSGHVVWPGFNDLASRNPDLAKEWHPTKNGTLTPGDVAIKSNYTVWWYMPYDDPETGRHFDFEWKADIYNRNDGDGCPYLSGRAVWPGFNDLASRNPDLAKEWHPTKNGTLTPKDVATNSGKEVWWCLPYDDPETGKHFDFKWKAAVSSRNDGAGCPYLSGRAVWPGFNDLFTKREYLIKDWDWDKNRFKDPKKIFYNTTTKVWWKCHICKQVWRTAVVVRSTIGCGCPRSLYHSR